MLELLGNLDHLGFMPQSDGLVTARGGEDLLGRVTGAAPHFIEVGDALVVTLDNDVAQLTLRSHLENIGAPGTDKQRSVLLEVNGSEAGLRLPGNQLVDVNGLGLRELSVPLDDHTIRTTRVESVVCALFNHPKRRGVSLELLAH